ncbi:MAG: sulfate ABC transporter substrate-binding protein [Azospirillaceae bacterium]|nr:sulfate ABC transporter substrate-binding protein [Azospirillaceae bacterium]
MTSLAGFRRGVAVVAACAALWTTGAQADTTLLNVSYDPTRELYSDINAAFIAHWKAESGETLTINQSHGGSGRQARSVIDGQPADIVTLALAYDIDAIADSGQIAPNWQQRLPDNSTPYTSTIVFVVRKGNPKGIKDWNDLVKPGLDIITPNPKTSGGARWNYLAAYGYALSQPGADDKAAQQFIRKLYKNVSVLDSGARGATISFSQRGLGDVLISWENDAYLAQQEAAADHLEIIYPSVSIRAEPPVSVVDAVVDRRGTRKVAEAYLQFLYTPEAQKIAAKWFYRPRLPEAAAAYPGRFPDVKLLTVDEVFGGWRHAQQVHFADKGVFDQIYDGGK